MLRLLDEMRTLRGTVAGLALLAAACGGGAPAPTHGPAAEGEAPAAASYEKGPKGGRLFGTGDFKAEVTIYERGVPPQFRVYLYEKGKPLPPTSGKVRIDLHRFGNRLDKFAFSPEGDYLVGNHVVEEPHSFDAVVSAEYGGKREEWKYSQREGRVQLSEDAVRTSAIQVETAGPLEMKTLIELPGEIALNGDRVTHVVARMPGVLREIRKNQGDSVARGEVIAVVDSREFAEAKEEVFKTAHELEFARKALEREERLFKKNISSQASYQAQERAHREAELKHRSARQQLESLGVAAGAIDALLEKPSGNLTRYELRAPFDGVLIEKKVANGQAVTADEDLFTLADLSTVWVNVTVYAKDLNAVRVGQEVTIKSDALRAEVKGRILYIGSLVGGEARAATARVVLADPERRWRPGLFVSALVVQEEVTVPVAVKRDGLQKFRDWDVVFVRYGDEFEARPLELGRTEGDWVEVRSGLQAGEKYASTNSFILKADVGKAGASHDH